MVMALHLRPGATAVGPVLGELRVELGMDNVLAGVLTGLPGLEFAIFGVLAVAVALRLGLNHALLLALTLTGIGLLARSFAPGPLEFLLPTALALAGMALGNVLVPAFIKRNFPRHTASMTAAYTVLLALGATLPPALAGPLLALPGGWRASVGAWGATALLSALPWAVLALRERTHGRTGPAVRGHVSLGLLLRSRRAVGLALFFGVQSMQAYVQFGWVAQMYRDGGLDRETAALMISIVSGLGVPLGLLMPIAVARLRNLSGPIVAMGASLAAGYLGLWLAPATTPWLWAILLGLSGAAFPTAIALITARTRDPHTTTMVSGFTQPFGYVLAAAGPFTVGALHQVTGNWTIPLLALVASSVVMVLAGLVAAAPGYVDDELPPAR